MYGRAGIDTLRLPIHSPCFNVLYLTVKFKKRPFEIVGGIIFVVTDSAVANQLALCVKEKRRALCSPPVDPHKPPSIGNMILGCTILANYIVSHKNGSKDIRFRFAPIQVCCLVSVPVGQMPEQDVSQLVSNYIALFVCGERVIVKNH